MQDICQLQSCPPGFVCKALDETHYSCENSKSAFRWPKSGKDQANSNELNIFDFSIYYIFTLLLEKKSKANRCQSLKRKVLIGF